MTAEVGAHWLSQRFRGGFSLPTVDEVNKEIDRAKTWTRETMPNPGGGYFVGAYVTHDIDDLLNEMGLPTRRTNNFPKENIGSPRRLSLCKTWRRATQKSRKQ